ncbi:MAG: F0F1 ATP synthase subunit gamma [Candidatus Omnitrophica bacterium]|nr:F0F1 ATP synthase subunit gamma [Candidatus Omnitrophota bacterium]
MIPAGRLKSNMQFNRNLGDLIEVMKLAATSQFNQFRLREEPSLDFVQLLDEVFAVLLASGIKSDLLTPNAALPALILVVSSDEGFLGELNFLLVNKLMDIKRPQDSVVCVGEQGAHYLREIEVNFSSFDSPGEKIDPERLGKIRDYILKQYLSRAVGSVYVIYSRFINITSQQTELEALLPLAQDASSSRKPLSNLLIEPDARSVIKGWIKFWLDFRFYQIFWSAKLAEFAARIMHLEGSVQELGKINTHLRMEYFKYLHGLSDKSIRELSASRLLEKNK